MSLGATGKRPEQQVGRYAIFDEIAAGGMATVHLARLVGSGGFSRVVAAKRMHRHFLQDPEFKRMFLVEARLAARILHPNVVPIVDVLSLEDEIIIVMEYVHGESLLALMRAARKTKRSIPIPIGCAVVAASLEGLHAAHEAQNEEGAPLGIVHRDVSPQNVLVGADGVARVLDFGIAKAVHEQNQTNPGTLKGKFSYMAPEVVTGGAITRQADIFSAGVVLWEVLAGKMLFGGTSEHERLLRIVQGDYPSPRQYNAAVPEALATIVAKALAVEASARYATALDFAVEIESVVSVPSRRVIGAWVRQLAANTLDKRETLIHEIETSSAVRQDHLFIAPSQDFPQPQGLQRTNSDARTSLDARSATTDLVRRPAAASVLPARLSTGIQGPNPAAYAPDLSSSSVRDDSTPYASIAIGPVAAPAPAGGARRRRLLYLALWTTLGGAGLASLTATLVPRTKPPPPLHGLTVSTTAVSVVPPVPPRPVVTPESAPAVAENPQAIEETPATRPVTNPTVKPTPAQPKARRSVASSRRPSRARHAKQPYLPSEL